MLAPRELRQRPVVSTSPREVGYSTTSRGLGGHCREPAEPGRTGGARFVLFQARLCAGTV